MAKKTTDSESKSESKKQETDVKETTAPTEKKPAPAASEKKELTEEEKKKQEEEAKEKQHRLESYRKAGEIYRKIVEFAKPLIVGGAKVLDLCEKMEAKITELGGDVGFPANICINNVAAHYSAPREDTTIIADGDVVKVDLGVAIDGYLVDGAFTISLNKTDATKNLVIAVETAVLKGLSMIKPGVKTNEIGEATFKIIKGFGYNVIKDLAGHKIERWTIHGGEDIPNVPTPKGVAFAEDEVWAIECFASTGSGKIHATTQTYIYSYDLRSDRVPLRGDVSRKVLGWIGKNKKTLPFSLRELLKEFKAGNFALKELVNAGKLIEHPVLKEESKDVYVSQAEHTFMVTKDGIERLT